MIQSCRAGQESLKKIIKRIRRKHIRKGSTFFSNFFNPILFTFIHKSFSMSLIPNKKNKKDSRPGGGQQTGKPGAQNSKGKANTKAATRNTKLTGGSQRGS